jgi:hypothetical protein
MIHTDIAQSCGIGRLLVTMNTSTCGSKSRLPEILWQLYRRSCSEIDFRLPGLDLLLCAYKEHRVDRKGGVWDPETDQGEERTNRMSSNPNKI